MKTKILLTLSLLLLPPTYVFAEDAPAPASTNIPLYRIVTDIPDTAWLGLKSSFSRDALPGWALMLGSTAVLYHYDQDLLDGAQRQGRDWGLGNAVKYKAVWKAGNLTLWSAPTDTAGWLYFMGDGTIPILMSAGFVGGGYFGGSSHLYNTGAEMANGLLTAAVFDQVVKHIAGRESPSARSQPRGEFRPLPPLKAYRNNTSKYDAMPSGHIMTATVMFTVIEQEYPELNAYMYPLEAAWIGVLGFGMMNVGVHWASDYPLGIAMGYVFGKSAVTLNHPEKKKEGIAANWRFFPGIDPVSGANTMNGLYSF